MPRCPFKKRSPCRAQRSTLSARAAPEGAAGSFTRNSSDRNAAKKVNRSNKMTAWMPGQRQQCRGKHRRQHVDQRVGERTKAAGFLVMSFGRQQTDGYIRGGLLHGVHQSVQCVETVQVPDLQSSGLKQYQHATVHSAAKLSLASITAFLFQRSLRAPAKMLITT